MMWELGVRIQFEMFILGVEVIEDDGTIQSGEKIEQELIRLMRKYGEKLEKELLFLICR